MVDVYLSVFNSQRSLFSDSKAVAKSVVENPKRFRIYEGLSALAANISRYDLPDPDVYARFFSAHPLQDFPPLSATCSFWRGCPLSKLDAAISYDLPELLAGYRRAKEDITAKAEARKRRKEAEKKAAKKK